MKPNKKYLVPVLFLLMGLVSVDPVSAEATREIYSDGGLYTGDVPQVCVGSNSGSIPPFVTLTEPVGGAGTPEGNKVFQMVATAAGAWMNITNYKNIPPNSGCPTRSTYDYFDYSAYSQGEIRFWLKSTSKLIVNVQWTVVTNNVNTNQKSLLQVQPGVPFQSTGGLWKEEFISIPNQLGAGQPLWGVDLSHLVTPFLISSAPPNASFSIDHVRWIKQPTKLAIYPSAQSNLGQGFRKQFTVEGLDANNEPVIIYPTFASSAGSINPSGIAMATVLTGSAASGTASVDAKYTFTLPNGQPKTLQVSASVNGISGTAVQRLEYGLYSETIPGVTLAPSASPLNPNADAALIVYPPTLKPTLTVVNSGAPEGLSSLDTLVNLSPNQTDYSGWAIQWGVCDSFGNVPCPVPNLASKDMSAFYDGSLRFWFKAPLALKDLIYVSIRSSNIDPGKEISKVKLGSTYEANHVDPFLDGNWHPMVIPMSVFAKARPWADISRTQTFFAITATNPVVGIGPQTFSVDNIRWDSRIPGTLTTLSISPKGSVDVPFNGKRQFIATGFDAQGTQVDISPTWTLSNPAQGQSPNPLVDLGGGVVRFDAVTSGVGTLTGQLIATVGSKSRSITLNVLQPVIAARYIVYSDPLPINPPPGLPGNFGGTVGVATGGVTNPLISPRTDMALKSVTGGVPLDPVTAFNATYSLINSPGLTRPDAFAVWFVDENLGSRFMNSYDVGYLRFFVKATGHDLVVSINSANVDPDLNRAKFYLKKDLGVVLDGTWQEVLIALNDFKIREPLLDLSQIKTYFTIGAVSEGLTDQPINSTFDVDYVTWVTSKASALNPDLVYQGLMEKQDSATTGLVRSYDTLNQAFTYDQALAAMNFNYRKDLNRSIKVFDFYYAIYQRNGILAPIGFADEYDVNTGSVLNGDVLVGPNAFLLLSLIHYRNVSGFSIYDQLIDSLALWLRSQQDLPPPFGTGDGGMRFGIPVNSALSKIKSTEHNLDTYAAFKAYALFKGDPSYDTAAQNILKWLQTKAWNSAEGRFNVGVDVDGTTINTDKALDVYSLAPLALSPTNNALFNYTALLNSAFTDFHNTKPNATTGIQVDGFDFSGCYNLPRTGYNVQPDKDAVWLEGTAQMALAYKATNQPALADDILTHQFANAVSVISPSGAQGFTYATNAGTMYAPCGSGLMNSQNAAVSSMAWYLFAFNNFNPLNPFGLDHFLIKNISDPTTLASQVNWNVDIDANPGWVLADQYVEVYSQRISVQPWLIRIYTDNADPTLNPRFVDPTPCLPPLNDIYSCNNPDSDPSGILLAQPGVAITEQKIPVAWSIKAPIVPLVAPVPADPNDQILFGKPQNNDNSFQWFYLSDINTPQIDRDGDGKIIIFPDPTCPMNDPQGLKNCPDTQMYARSGNYVLIQDPRGIHTAQGPDPNDPSTTGFDFTNQAPNNLFFEADFTLAGAQVQYKTNVVIEFISF